MNWSSPRVTEKSDQTTAVEIWSMIGTLKHVYCTRVCWNVCDSLDICISTSFAVYNIGNPLAMRLIFLYFYLKYSKLNVDFGNAVKTWEKNSSFLDKWNWIGYIKISLLPREYLSSGVNMLTNSFKVKTDIYKLNFSRGDGKVQ